MNAHPSPSATQPSTWLTLTYMAFGPLVWAACHGLLYALHWMLCVLAARGGLAVGLIAITLHCVAGICAALLVFAIWRSDFLARVMLLGTHQVFRRFSQEAMRLLAVLSLFGVVAAYIAIALLPTCA